MPKRKRSKSVRRQRSLLRRRGCELSAWAWWTGIDLCGCVFLILILILIQYGLDIDIDDGDDDDGVYVTLNTNLFLKSSLKVRGIT